MLKVVLDTNVFGSGLLTKSGPPAAVIDAWRNSRYLLVTSPPLISEIERVLETHTCYHLEVALGIAAFTRKTNGPDRLQNSLRISPLVREGFGKFKGGFPPVSAGSPSLPTG